MIDTGPDYKMVLRLLADRDAHVCFCLRPRPAHRRAGAAARHHRDAQRSCRATSRARWWRCSTRPSRFERPTSSRSTAAARCSGDVAVLNGPVTIGGHVTGRVLAINADVVLQRGARIDGDLLVVGGEVEGAEGARIGGEMRVYHPPLRYTQEGDQLVAQLEEGTDDQWWRRWERRGRTQLQSARDRERRRLQSRRRAADARRARALSRSGVGTSATGRHGDPAHGEQLLRIERRTSGTTCMAKCASGGNSARRWAAGCSTWWMASSSGS